MKKKDIIALDLGRSAVKVYEGYSGFIFPSKLAPAVHRNYAEYAYYDVELHWEWDGKEEGWYVGEMAERESTSPRSVYTTETKAVKETLILALAALYRARKTGNVDVVSGLPLNLYTDAEKQAMKELFERKHNVIINGESYSVRIDNLYLTPEGVGSFWADPKPGKIQLIDLGARTTHFLYFQDKMLVNNKSLTHNYGAESNGSSTDYKNLVPFILDKVDQLNWSKDCPTLVAGGAAHELVNLLKDEFSDISVQTADPRLSNAIGYLKIAKVQLGL